MILVGLTGSIAMGKSTLATIFRNCGYPVFDADEAVRECYSNECVAEIESVFPGVVGDGQVNRERLAKYVVGDELAMKRLESIVHPAVAKRRSKFLEGAVGVGSRVAFLDVPLLFETAGDRAMDVTIVVSARPEIQRTRAISRPAWTETRFDSLLARQMPDLEKRRRAHYIIDSSGTLEESHIQAVGFLRAVLGMSRANTSHA